MPPKLTASEWMMLPFNIGALWAKIGLCYVESFFRMFVQRRMKSLKNKVVLITGAGQGIGRQLALKFGALDTRLALWDINVTGCEETAELVKENGGTAFAYKCDITDVDAVKQAAEETRRDLGDVDVVVNNAGIMIVKPFMKLTQSDIRRTFDINTVAHFWILQEFLPAMMDKNEGHVVTISSMAGRGGVSLLTDYCASKFACFGFTEALNEEMRKMGKDIKTTTVCPSFVNTNLVHGITHRATVRNKRGGDILEPDAVAQAIVDGMRRDNRYVYLPPALEKAVKIGSLWPIRARAIVADFVDAGFEEVTAPQI